MNSVHCPYCNHEVSSGEINIQKGAGICGSCSKIFDLNETPEFNRYGAANPSLNEADQIRPRAEPPRTISVEKTMRGHEIKVKWIEGQYIFLAFFATFWDGFLIFWYAALLSKPISSETIPGLLFPILHVIAGVCITYTVLAGFLNTTTISLENGRFKLNHGPLPWIGKLELDSDDLTQFFIIEHIGNKGARTHNLCALKKDNTKIFIMKQSIEKLKFIEQKLEELLNIKDVRVTGEYQGY